MSLSGLLTAIDEYVGDVLVTDLGRPSPRVLRYHGIMPHDCCDDAGFLVSSWEPMRPTPGSQDPCQFSLVTLNVRYVTCWPAADVDAQTGVVINTDQWDTPSAVFADVALAVTRALIRLGCQPDMTDPFVAAVFAHTGRTGVIWQDTAPIPALGLCAGVQWRAVASVRGETPAS